MIRNLVFSLLIFLLFLPLGCALSERGPIESIGGVVVDSYKRPLGGVSVRIIGESILTETKEDGSFFITGLPPGREYTIEFSLAGYKSREEKIYLHEGREVSLLIELTPTQTAVSSTFQAPTPTPSLEREYLIFVANSGSKTETEASVEASVRNIMIISFKARKGINYIPWPQSPTWLELAEGGILFVVDKTNTITALDTNNGYKKLGEIRLSQGTITDLKFNPANQKLYFAGAIQDGLGIGVIDVKSVSLIKFIPILLSEEEATLSPACISFSPKGELLFLVLSNYEKGFVKVINLDTESVIASITAGRFAYGVVPSLEGDRLFITNFIDNNLFTVNFSNLQLISQIPTGINPARLGLCPTTEDLYVLNTKSNTVSIINTLTGKIVMNLQVGKHPADIKFSPDGLYAFISNNESDNVTIINTTYRIIYGITEPFIYGAPMGLAVK